MKAIVNWSAKRSGAGITVIGKTAATAEDITVSGITEIAPNMGKLVATAADGNTHELLI